MDARAPLFRTGNGKQMKFSTKAVHVGQEPDETTGAIIPPIYMTSTFVHNAPGEHYGYEYTRAGNPNFTRLEALLASLEDAKYATVFSSGLGATTAWLASLQKEDHVVALDGLYGGTYRLFMKVFHKFGVHFHIINYKDKEKLKNALSNKPEWFFFETPTNPLLEIIHIEEMTGLAKKYGVKTLVDNTFATPYLQNPLALGADAVLHSTTKYIGGHSDTIGGAIMTNDKKFKEDIDFNRKAIGLNPSPFDVWLTTRGVKTLALRMEQHQKSAMAFAEFLKKHPKVEKVYYPGLSTHPHHDIAKKQMKGFGGMVSVDFKLSVQDTHRLISSLKHFALAESLGGVESLVSCPAAMTHASIPKEERTKMGISDSLVRFSLGIEDTQDLIDDVKNALDS